MPLFGEFFYDSAKWRESEPFAEQLKAFQELIEEGKVLYYCTLLLTAQFPAVHFAWLALAVNAMNFFFYLGGGAKCGNTYFAKKFFHVQNMIVLSHIVEILA